MPKTNTTLTAATITTEQISDLRREAAEAGDAEQVSICNHALDAAESRNRSWSVEEARELCAAAINAGQG